MSATNVLLLSSSARRVLPVHVAPLCSDMPLTQLRFVVLPHLRSACQQDLAIEAMLSAGPRAAAERVFTILPLAATEKQLGIHWLGMLRLMYARCGLAVRDGPWRP